MFGYAVIAAVVYDAQLLEHVAPDGGLDRPVVAVGGLVVAVQPLDVHDFRVEPFQYDADVLDGQMFFLFAGQLVDEQQELLAGHRVVLDHGGLRLGLGTVVRTALLLLLLLPPPVASSIPTPKLHFIFNNFLTPETVFL